MQAELLEPWGGRSAGESIEVDAARHARLVELGIARGPEPPAELEAHPVKKKGRRS